MFFVYLSFLAILIALFFNSFILVPKIHYGVCEIFGQRTGRILYEGLHLRWPLVERVELVLTELSVIQVVVKLTTKDKLQLECIGSLQYRADPEINRDNGQNIFIEMSEKVISSGIDDAIESKLGALGGVHDHEEFIEKRQAIADLINCSLRMGQGTIPHLNHPTDGSCGVVGCGYHEQVEAQKLLDFYVSHWRWIKPALDGEVRRFHDHSIVETRYGIDVVAYVLAQVDFSSDTKAAFEKKKQAEARAGAFDTKIEMARKAMALGASPQNALNAADVSLDPSITKTIQSIEGDAGILGGLITALRGGK